MKTKRMLAALLALSLCGGRAALGTFAGPAEKPVLLADDDPCAPPDPDPGGGDPPADNMPGKLTA